MLQVYEFTVIARDGGKIALEGYAKVIVTLIDVNDNQPVFEPAKYQVSKHKPLKTTLKHWKHKQQQNGRLSCSNTVQLTE